MSISVVHAQEQRWQRVMVGERHVGHVALTRRQEGANVFETERLEIHLGAPGRRVTYRVALDTESTADGSLLRMVREVKTREGHSLVAARVIGADLEITTGVGRSRKLQTLKGAGAGLKSVDFERAWLASVGRGEHPSPLLYASWDPIKLAVIEVELRRAPDVDLARVERRSRTVTQLTASRLDIDTQGAVAKETMRLGSLVLELVAATEAQALAKTEVLDHVAEQLQRSPYRIPTRDMRAKIRYGFDNHGKAPQLPSGAGQRTWNDGQTTYIQVCASCELDAAGLPAEERERALQPTQWLQSDDRKLSNRAHAIATGAHEPAAKMKRLTEFVRGRMSVDRIDMLGYGTALEAFNTGRGDCTEYAVLLAAMGRAVGIPTRVAIGSVYARHFEGKRHVFVPHAWAQAWTGSGWQSFDAAIGTFDSTHLAFAVNYDGNPATHSVGANLAHELTLTTAARVLPRKAATTN